MPSRRDYAEYREELRDSKYPFADQATLTNQQVSWPRTALVDAVLHPAGGGPRFYIAKVIVSPHDLQLVVEDQRQTEVARGIKTRDDPAAELMLQDSYGVPAGMLLGTSEGWDTLSSWPLGTHRFRIEDTELVAAVCCPVPNYGVRQIRLDDGSFVANEVWLIGGDGIAFELSHKNTLQPPHTSVPVLRAHAWGDPMSKFYELGMKRFAKANWRRYLTNLVVQVGCTQMELGFRGVLQPDYEQYPDTALKIRVSDQSLEFSLEP